MIYLANIILLYIHERLQSQQVRRLTLITTQPDPCQHALTPEKWQLR